MAALARVSFYLKILFFKIKLSLTTDVAFYDDSAQIPMMIYLPYSAEKNLHPRSGILYSWVKAPGAERLMQQDGVPPALDGASNRYSVKGLAAKGTSFCDSVLCRYRMPVRASGRDIMMDFFIPPDFAKLAFFPQRVDDVADEAKSMGWGESYESAKKREGFYFELSGLPEGLSPWNFWIRLTDAASAARCPLEVKVEKLR